MMEALKNRMKTRNLVMMALLLFAGVVAARAQTTGVITGVVTDKQGAVVPAVQVVARNTTSGEIRTAATNQAGEYSFPAMQPGDYEITFSGKGFATMVEIATLNVTERIAVNTVMQVSSVATTVEVTAQDPLLQTESVTQGGVIDGENVQQLPLASNNFTQLLALSPGVSGELNDATGLGRGTQNINANGARTSSNSIYIDGIDAVNVHVNSAANNTFASNGTIIPPPASIQEFKVQTALFDASTGRSGGSNIFLITRTGGGKIHGQIYEQFRNDAMNANNFFFNALGQRRPKLEQNQFGATIGGPIYKNKIHGFFAYQGTRQINGYTGSSTLTIPNTPTDRSRASLGAFGNSLGATSHTGPKIALDGSNISATAFALLNYKLPNGQYIIPSPNGTSSTTSVNYAVSVPSTFNEDEYVGSVDYQVGSKDRLAFHTIIAEQPQFQSLPMTLSVPGFGLSQRFKSRLYSAAETHIFSPNVVNELRVGVSRLLGHTAFENQVPLSSIGMSKFNSGDFPNIPLIELSGAFELGYSVNADQADIENTWQYFDNVSWLKGKHNMNFGVEMRRYQDNYFSNNRQAGSIDIISMQNFMLGLNGQSVAAGGNGTGYSDIFSYSVASGVVQRYDRIRDVALFVQDSWKPVPRVTINAGLRYEYIGLPTDIYGRDGAFDPRKYQAPPLGGFTSIGFVQAGNAVHPVPGIAKVSNTLTDTVDKLNLGPRIGMAVKLNSRMVARAGYGLFYDRLSNQLGLLESLSLPNYVRSDDTNSSSPPVGKVPQSPLNANATLSNPFPTLPLRSQFPVLPQVYSYAAVNAPAPIAINDIDPQLRTPYYQQFGFNIQTQITPFAMLEVGYVGARGLHLPVETEINQAQIASTTRPINGNTDNSGSAQIRAPYQGFGIQGLFFLQTNHESNYNSMQDTLTIRKGRTNALITYTYSKSLDTASGTVDGSVFTTTTGDQTNQLQAYGPSDFDRRHRVAGRWVYAVPNPHWKFVSRRLSNGLFGGYEISGTAVVQTGKPVDVESSSTGSWYGTDTSRASYNTGMGFANTVQTGRTEDRLKNYFTNTVNNVTSATQNPAAVFAIGGPLYGTIGRNVLRGPAQRNIDVSVSKRTNLGDGLRAEFRVQAFNVFNYANFGQPSGNADTSSFGRITSTTGNPRILQLVLRLEY